MSFLFRRQKIVRTIPKKNRRARKYFLWGVALLFAGIFTWVIVATGLAWNSTQTKNTTPGPSFFKFNGTVPADQLQGEGDGRINILMVGIGGEGALTDSIQVISVDPVNKSMTLLSVPRDLYVTLPDKSRGKINAVYVTANNLCKTKGGCDPEVDAGGAALKSTISSILGVPIHYFVKLDFTGFSQIIDQLGGVQVYVEKPLSDPFYPDAKLQGYEPLYISAGWHNFDGKTALKYARSRETTSDFDRARRQQQIIQAAKAKALSANVLANPKKLTDILATLGSHLKTDLTTEESYKLFQLIKDISPDKTTTKVLDTSGDSPLISQNDSAAGYIILPKKGFGNYADVQDYAESFLPEPYLIEENASITILNATGKTTNGPLIKQQLQKLGYNIAAVIDAPKAEAGSTLNVNNSKKPYTDTLLKRRFSATEKGSTSTYSTDFVITVGSSYKIK